MSNLSIEPNERITFRVRFEDEDLLIVEKRSGLVTEPGRAHESDSLLNGVFAAYGPRLQNLGRDRGFGLLHRLDKETSGLVAVALSARAYEAMRELFEARDIRKFYWAVCQKQPRLPKGVVRTPIGERVERVSRWSTRKHAQLGSGKPALTAYRVIEASDLAALIEARPVTGRMHQVRLHLSSIGAPVLGDDLYGPEAVREASPRLALHAYRLAFDHPITGEVVDVRTGWPRDLRPLLRRMRLARPDLAEDTEEPAGDAVGEQEPGV